MRCHIPPQYQNLTSDCIPMPRDSRAEQLRGKRPSVHSSEPVQMTATTLLSEDNLRRHNAAYRESNTRSRVQTLQYATQASEHDLCHGTFSDNKHPDYAHVDLYEEDVDFQREASLDALKLYTAAFPLFEADSYTRMAKDVLGESGGGFSDLECLDLGQLASEMVHIEVTLNDTRGSSVGSPSPSSDTLSVTRDRVVRNSRREGTKNRKRVGMRRRGTADRTKMARCIVHNAAR